MAIPVKGVTSNSCCVQWVERTLIKKEGVAEAGFNFAAHKPSVVYDSTATKNPDELIWSIWEAKDIRRIYRTAREKESLLAASRQTTTSTER